MGLEKVIVFGASGHAKVVIDILEKQEKYQIVGIVDLVLSKGSLFQGYSILGNDDELEQIMNKHPQSKFFVAIGDNWIRNLVVQKIKSNVPSAEFVTAIHPTAVLASDVQIGQGSVIMPGVIINSGTKIGDFTIVNTRANIDHDCKIADFSSIAPNAGLGGEVTVGEFSVVAMGCIVRNNIVIGQHTILGAGSLVLKSFGDNMVVYGNPATFIRTREIGESYLS